MGKKFKKLERKIEKYYEHERGYGHKRSKHIADATAGMIYRMKLYDGIKGPHQH